MTANGTRRQRHTGSIWQIGRIWWIQYYWHGHRTRESSHSDNVSIAKQLLRKRLSQVTLRVYRPHSRLRYEEIRDAFIADYVRKGRRSLRFDAEGNPRPLDKVKRLDEYFAGFRVEDITGESLGNFVTQQKQKGRQPATINRSLSALRRMFRLAVKQGKLTLNDVPPFELEVEPEAREGFFEPEQYAKLFPVLPDYLRPVIAIAFHSGMRSGEVRSIRWEQVDFKGGVINLKASQTKGKRRRALPIFGELREILTAQYEKRQPECPYVCFRVNRAGRAIKIGDFRKAWQNCCVRVGLGKFEQGIGREGQPIKVYRGMLVHDFRRSGVRNLVRAGVHETVARRISGHKTRSVFDRYDITSEKDLRDAGEKLEAYLNSHSSAIIPDAQSPGRNLVN